MDAVREYLVSVTAAALICGIAGKLVSGTAGTVVKIVSGVLMLLAVVNPWVDIRLSDLSEFTTDIQIAAENAAMDGVESSMEALRNGITEQVRTYILDKAQTLEAELTVEVELTDDTLPVPCCVTLRGRISPYAKTVLSEYIEEKLGITAEAQVWIL